MFLKIAKGIDWFNNKQGQITSMLCLPLLGVVVYEVILRYGFDAPAIWTFEATAFIYGMHYMFGLAYTDVHDGHVRVDIFTAQAPKKVQAAINALTNMVLFLPVMTCLTIYTGKFAWDSTVMLEHNSTSWAPAIYPYKIIMALCFLFLLLQGVSNLIKDLHRVFAKEER